MSTDVRVETLPLISCAAPSKSLSQGFVISNFEPLVSASG